MRYTTRMFDDLHHVLSRFDGALPVRQAERGFPAVESFERDGRIVLRAELPGVSADDLDIEVTGRNLAIRGEKKSHRGEDGSERASAVHYYGSFERTFTLPEGVKADQVVASLQNGVLELSVPAEALKPVGHKVPIQGLPAGKKTEAA